MSSLPCTKRPDAWSPKTDLGKRSKAALEQAREVRAQIAEWAIGQCENRCPAAALRDCAAGAVASGAKTGIWAGVDLGESERAPIKGAVEKLRAIAEGHEVEGTPDPAIGRICTDVAGDSVEDLKAEIETAATELGCRIKGWAISGSDETVEGLLATARRYDAYTVIVAALEHLPDLDEARRIGEIVILNPNRVVVSRRSG